MFSGIFMPSVMTWKMFKTLLAFLSVSVTEEMVASHGDLNCMSSLLKHMNQSSALHFQPCQKLFISERIVKLEVHSGTWRYIGDKHVKRAYKSGCWQARELGTLFASMRTNKGAKLLVCIQWQLTW